MTDAKREAQIRERYAGLQGDMPPFGDVLTLLRLLDEARAAALWRPIETAPKDGTLVQCWPRDDEHATVSWRNGRWAVACCGQTHYDITHWQPIAEPPP